MCMYVCMYVMCIYLCILTLKAINFVEWDTMLVSIMTNTALCFKLNQ